jgi:hypothetical protein
MIAFNRLRCSRPRGGASPNYAHLERRAATGSMEPMEPARNRAADRPRYVRIGLAFTDRRLTQYVLTFWFPFDGLASPPR